MNVGSSIMAISLDSFNQARTNFQQSYFLANCNSNFGGQDIRLSWDTFSGYVNDFIAANNVPASSVALRFVYCYDAASNALYLRLQILTMTQSPTDQNVYNLNANPCAWYTISSGAMASTTNTNLNDPAYLNNFYYCGSTACTAASLQNLGANPSIYPQMATFPWAMEVNQMYLDNNSPTSASIGFAAGAFAAGAGASVTYPQTIIMYLADSNGTLLIDNTQSAGFEMKAGDMGTLCPATCRVYVTPTAPGSNP